MRLTGTLGTAEKPLFEIEHKGFQKDGYPSACWIWKRCLSDGYAVVSQNAKMRHGHKVMHEALNGPIEKGLVLDHLCRNRDCIRPDHLEPVTIAENIRRGVGTSITRGLVEEMRAQYIPRSLTHGGYALARKYGIKIDTIGHIMRGDRWK